MAPAAGIRVRHHAFPDDQRNIPGSVCYEIQLRLTAIRRHAHYIKNLTSGTVDRSSRRSPPAADRRRPEKQAIRDGRSKCIPLHQKQLACHPV